MHSSYSHCEMSFLIHQEVAEQLASLSVVMARYLRVLEFPLGLLRASVTAFVLSLEIVALMLTTRALVSEYSDCK